MTGNGAGVLVLIYSKDLWAQHLVAWLKTAILCVLVGTIPIVTGEGREAGPQEGIAVVVHTELVSRDIPLPTLRSIFSARKRSWDNGQTISVFVLSDEHAVHKRFCRLALKMYPYVLRDHWDRITFSGTGVAPTVMESEEALLQQVRRTPGAIGYISFPVFEDAPVKIIALPGDETLLGARTQ